MLEAQHLSMRFNGEPVLDDISLKLNKGESLVLWGSSGSGKSTLLALLGLILTPSAGDVIVEGRTCGKLDESTLAFLRRNYFGFIFQHTQLVSSLRAVENVMLPVHLHTPSEKRELTERLGNLEHRAKELLVTLGLEQRLYHYPHQLSVGQKRRIALARALICDAPIILADEPTNDLDASNAQTVMDLLLDAAKQANKAVVIATHDADFVSRADSCYELEK